MVNVISVRVYPKTIETNPGLWYYGAVAEVCPACATCTGVVWHSSDTSVATVNESNGYIYAKSAGTAKIYATAVDGSGKNDYLTITVRNSPIMVESISLNKTSISLEIGDEYTLSTTICPENAANKSVIWSSSNTNIASVDNGVVTARAVGSAVIQATAADGSGKSSCCTVSVTEDVLVSSVETNPERIKLVMGKSASLCATVCPTNATEKCLRWTSSDMEVAIVNPASGIVTARNAGEATIYATATDGSGKYGSCEVEVVEPIYVESITVCPENLTMNVGENKTVYANVCPTDATNKSVMWTSSDPTVATVGFYTGIVEAVGAGEVTITATTVDGSYTDSVAIKVYIDTVTVSKDGYFNKVVFHSTGKVWKCVNNDLLYDDNNINNIELADRSNDNCFVYYDRNDFGNQDLTLKTYTDEELKLLYAIDPYGVAHYVYLYAMHNFETLGAKIAEKDRVFRVLFNREPKYFSQNTLGEWYQVNPPENTTGYYDNIYSESETIFGMHTNALIRDQVLEMLYSIASFATSLLPSSIGIAVNIISNVADIMLQSKKLDNVYILTC